MLETEISLLEALTMVKYLAETITGFRFALKACSLASTTCICGVNQSRKMVETFIVYEHNYNPVNNHSTGNQTHHTVLLKLLVAGKER